jgi:hypothetical protein
VRERTHAGAMQPCPTGGVFPILGPLVEVSTTVADGWFETVVAFMGRPLPDNVDD